MKYLLLISIFFSFSAANDWERILKQMKIKQLKTEKNRAKRNQMYRQYIIDFEKKKENKKKKNLFGYKKQVGKNHRNRFSVND